jgi:LPXTG-site transpeptidase (sortase) family protein
MPFRIKPHHIVIALGMLLLLSGAGMRVYASMTIHATIQRLVPARPQSLEFVPASVPLGEIPTRIAIPSLNLWNDLTIVYMRDGIWETADAAWHASSGVPGAGENIVIAGHSPSSDPDVWARSVFRQLAYLTPGDAIHVTAGAEYVYRVQHVFAIPESRASAPESVVWIASDAPERLTLVTCYPPHTADYRVIVIAALDPKGN